MKRIAWTTLAALVLVALAIYAGGAAETADYADYLPEGAAFVKEEKDDGAAEVEYKGLRGEKYELLVGPDGTVLALEADMNIKAESKDATLTAEEAFGFITAAFPEARFIAAAVDTDGKKAIWVVLFEDADALNVYELDGGTGAVLAYDRFFGYAADTDPTAQIFMSYPAAEITEINLDFEGGKAIYEGEATVDGVKYDFKVDHATGQLLLWEMDD